MLFRPDDGTKVVMKHWRVIEVSSALNREKTRHLVGRVGDYGQVCSPIQEFDTETMSAITRSGKRYELLGYPGVSVDAEYVIESWCNLNRIDEVTDVTHEYYQGFTTSRYFDIMDPL